MTFLKCHLVCNGISTLFSEMHCLCNWCVIQEWLSIDTERVSPSPLTPRNCHCLQRTVEILTYFIMPAHCCQDVIYICERVITGFYFEHILTQWFGAGYRSPYLFQYSYHDKIKFFEVQVNILHFFSFIFFLLDSNRCLHFWWHNVS